jgi:molybdopterin-guanine dinucleotide biosynthesis protein MobB
VKTFGIVGRKNSGKTHLVVRLVGELRRRGLTVSTVKHTHHHDVQFDVPGKDSWRHREAGAQEVIVASDRGWSLVHAGADAGPPPSLDGLLQRLAPCDVVLVEGYKGFTRHPRIEVYRPGAADPLAARDAGIVALACPAGQAPAEWPTSAARLDLDDTVAIADFVLAQGAEASGTGNR